MREGHAFDGRSDPREMDAMATSEAIPPPPFPRGSDPSPTRNRGCGRERASAGAGRGRNGGGHPRECQPKGVRSIPGGIDTFRGDLDGMGGRYRWNGRGVDGRDGRRRRWRTEAIPPTERVHALTKDLQTPPRIPSLRPRVSRTFRKPPWTWSRRRFGPPPLGPEPTPHPQPFQIPPNGYR